jgi:hypothetical protein
MPTTNIEIRRQQVTNYGTTNDRDTDIRCKCGGQIAVKDWKTRGEWRYEAFCRECGSCDPNGYGSMKATLEGAAKYFGEKAVTT